VRDHIANERVRAQPAGYTILLVAPAITRFNAALYAKPVAYKFHSRLIIEKHSGAVRTVPTRCS